MRLGMKMKEMRYMVLITIVVMSIYALCSHDGKKALKGEVKESKQERVKEAAASVADPASGTVALTGSHGGDTLCEDTAAKKPHHEPKFGELWSELTKTYKAYKLMQRYEEGDTTVKEEDVKALMKEITQDTK